jgi:hypothetical protein
MQSHAGDGLKNLKKENLIDIIMAEPILVFLAVSLLIGLFLPTQNILGVAVSFNQNIWNVQILYTKLPYLQYLAYSQDRLKPEITNLGNAKVIIEIKNPSNTETFSTAYNITEGNYILPTYQIPNLGDSVNVTIIDPNLNMYQPSFQKVFTIAQTG